MDYSKSEVIWVVLTLIFVLGVYIATKVIRKSENNPAATWAQRHVLIMFIMSFVLPLVAGVALVNTVFGSGAGSFPASEKEPQIEHIKLNKFATPMHDVAYLGPRVYDPLVRVVITDDPDNISIKALNKCRSDQLTMIKGPRIECKDNLPVELKAWIDDARIHKKREIENYVEGRRRLDSLQHRVPKLNIKPMQQAFLATPAKSNSVRKESVWDKYAELIYFLTLVIGVLSKYFWDYHEDRKKGDEKTKFDPGLVLKSFIIAMLVYYGVQGLLENEAGRLSWGGVLLAFNNGFTWQTVLTTVSANSDSKSK